MAARKRAEGRSPGALFRTGGGRHLPSPSATGPRGPGHLHGGAVAALVAARALEVLGEERPPARLTVDFLGPVPAAPLEVTAERVRAGRSFDVVDVCVRAGGVPVARGGVVGVRRARTALPRHLPREPRPPSREEGWALPDTAGRPSFNRDAAELVLVDDPANPYGGTGWARLRRAVVEGGPRHGCLAAVALADLAHGVGAVLPPHRYHWTNLDLTVHLERPPEGEWIALRARTRAGTGGLGTAEAVLLDSAGAFGSAAQTLLIDGTRDGEQDDG
ncbi:thioesterase family protein [Streptomyces sp. TRM 70361]|uniref:thioesterase family protein n=1 Tax=Streptomyces sp. TRM 70361 TaxID=3116553 RepID=UPI002E7C07D0|nr:thioesterase family protein [Streptomyces sp. TRM 70361]MEE1938039.1 thioesterase family protein [Streptomyces sp. TRM 70361]